MAKASVRFVCRSCGAVHPRWMGKCPDCGQWDALEEYRVAASAARDAPRSLSATLTADQAPQAVPLAQVGEHDGQVQRQTTGIGELDRVLGGGLVPGSAILVGGDPGIGKSTLMLQAAGRLAANATRVLYVTSEESLEQLRLRAHRLTPPVPTPLLSESDGGASEGAGNPSPLAPHPSLPADDLYVLADTNLARIVEQARRTDPAVVIVDSIQMIYKGDLAAAPGSVTQLRACCQELVYFAKSTGAALLMVGHVTKRGQLAGPRLLEHMVDAVLYFEGDRYHNHRVVRGIKNRFGTTLEVGLFEMTDAGLREAGQGAGLPASEHRAGPGSVVCPVLQGSRCLLVELQALTATGFLGTAKRKTSGIDSSRLAMLIAVLEKRGELRLADQDIFASSVGGMRILEPAADLALALAVAGAHYNRKLESAWCAFGEIGLGGEVRHVQQMDQRFREAGRLGFTHIVCPAANVKPPAGVELIPVKTLDQALQLLA